MLSPAVTQQIRHCYQNLKDQLPHFVSRRGQNYLVAEIAKTLGGEYHAKQRMLVAEAGTGIGKSLAYLMGAVPFALHHNKKVVIATATVALQEQLLNKDLPLFRRIYDKPMDFILAKGRQRYCCAHKLAASLEDDSQMALWQQKPKAKEIALLKRMQTAYGQGKWDGDIDSWPTAIPHHLWQQIQSDKHSCHNGLAAHRDCPFQKARNHLDKADVIIANHALMLADLELGGGVILPEPEQCIYVIDEAHHLPRVARDFSAASAALKGSETWLTRLNQASVRYGQAGDLKRSDKFVTALQSAISQLIPDFIALSQHIDPSQFSKDGIYRFAHGELPTWLSELAGGCKEQSKKAFQALGKLLDLVTERLKEGEINSKQADPIISEAGVYLQRLEMLSKTWHLMAEPERDKGAPLARWLSRNPDRDGDYIVHVSPIEVGYRLDQLLWSRAAGVILTSATLRALNSFDYFCRQAGIYRDSGCQFLALSSPFDYTNQARLVVPALKHEPQAQQFTQYLIDELPNYLAEDKASLVLFASYWQMNQVAESIEATCKKQGWQLLVQGKESRGSLLDKHKKAVDAGKVSIIFGTSSFSEGLDLAGDLLTNVIITKIPFAVPTSPVEEAHAEYVEANGGNAFMQIAVPEASRKLTQSVGRLLRKEKDSGRVVILDRRVISKRYGKALLDALPPFHRLIEQP
ncbi:ATP-dependent DNA helicase DinG [Vibrio stylophorae]|nr:ATP-dependent DNA helicase DinG [Vibrio stylophorae]